MTQQYLSVDRVLTEPERVVIADALRRLPIDKDGRRRYITLHEAGTFTEGHIRGLANLIEHSQVAVTEEES